MTPLVPSRKSRITYCMKRLTSYIIFGVFSDFVVQTCCIKDHKESVQAQSTTCVPFPTSLAPHSPTPNTPFQTTFQSKWVRCHQNRESPLIKDISPINFVLYCGTLALRDIECIPIVTGKSPRRVWVLTSWHGGFC